MWSRTEILTKNKYKLDEVVSALQKSIRRGQEETAAFWALELVDSGMAKYLWRRLMVIAAEDVGLGSPEILPLVAAGWLGTKECTRDWEAPAVEFLGTIVLAMCRAAKSREGDDLLWYVTTLRKQGTRLEIPDYALDEHTGRGRALKRGHEFWFEHAARFERPAVPALNHYGQAIRQLFATDAGERSEPTEPRADAERSAQEDDPLLNTVKAHRKGAS